MGEHQTHPPRSAPAGLPGLEHDDAGVGREGALLEEVRGEGACDATADDDDVGRGWQVRRGAEAEEVIGCFMVPLCESSAPSAACSLRRTPFLCAMIVQHLQGHVRRARLRESGDEGKKAYKGFGWLRTRKSGLAFLDFTNRHSEKEIYTR